MFIPAVITGRDSVMKALLGLLFLSLCGYGVYAGVMNPAWITDPGHLAALGVGIGWGIFIRGVLG
jgi:hypothetical protein